MPPTCGLPAMEGFFDAILPIIVGSELLIVGDFNVAEYVNFNDNSLHPLKLFCETFHLRQLNRVLNANNRLLDLVFTDIRSRIVVNRVISPLVLEDLHHPALYLEVDMSEGELRQQIPRAPVQRYNFAGTNFHGLYDHLFGVNWSCLEACSDVDIAANHFYSIL